MYSVESRCCILECAFYISFIFNSSFFFFFFFFSSSLFVVQAVLYVHLHKQIEQTLVSFFFFFSNSPGNTKHNSFSAAEWYIG